MENALKANSKDVAEQYERQLRPLKEAYGKVMLEVNFVKMLQRHVAFTEEQWLPSPMRWHRKVAQPLWLRPISSQIYSTERAAYLPEQMRFSDNQPIRRSQNEEALQPRPATQRFELNTHGRIWKTCSQSNRHIINPEILSQRT